MSVALALLTAHVLGDFPLQSDRMAANKLNNRDVRGMHCVVHMALALVCLGLVVSLQQAALGAGILGIMHFVIDTQRWAEPKEGAEWYPIAVDQSLHVTSLFIVSLLI